VKGRSGLATGLWTDDFGIADIDSDCSGPSGALGVGIIRPRRFGLSVGVRF